MRARFNLTFFLRIIKKKKSRKAQVYFVFHQKKMVLLSLLKKVDRKMIKPLTFDNWFSPLQH